MKRLSRESWIILGLVVILLVLTGIAALFQARSKLRPPALSSRSSTPNGAYALWLWLSKLGYTVSDHTDQGFYLPPELDIVLILEPVESITDQEWKHINAWVQEGGTLILVGESWATRNAVRHYDIEIVPLLQVTNTLTAQMPIYTPLPLKTQATAYPQTWLRTIEHQGKYGKYVVHFAVQDKPVVLSFSSGRGRVILGTTPFVFSNAGLKEPGNPEVVLNLLSLARRTGDIWFDEWHHGQKAVQRELAGPLDWLRFTPAGHAILYAATIGFISLLLWGQRFGRAVPLPQDTARRAPLEYITAMANLNRRAGHRRAVALQYYHQLKRHLGKRYQIDPTLPDDEYVARLALYNPTINATAFRTWLKRLNNPSTETEMIQLAAQVATWLKES